MKIGRPEEPDTLLGPLISHEHRNKVVSYFKKAVDEGAKVVTGGEIPTWARSSTRARGSSRRSGPGCRRRRPSCRRRSSARAAMCTPFDTEAEAVLHGERHEVRAGDARCGPPTSRARTGSLRRSTSASAGSTAGSCAICAPRSAARRIPGIGREGGVHSLEFYTELAQCLREARSAEKDAAGRAARSQFRRGMGPRARKGNRRSAEMTGGVVAAALVAHVPTLGTRQEHAGLPADAGAGRAHDGRGDARGAQARPVGDRLDALDLDVRLVRNLPAEARRVCASRDEAPNLIPGLPYSYRGDPEFGAALVDAWKEAGIAAVRNESPNYHWDYGTFVPLQYIDPSGRRAGRGHAGRPDGGPRRMPARRRGRPCGSEADQQARRVPHEQRALASARARAAQLADRRARRGGQAASSTS